MLLVRHTCPEENTLVQRSPVDGQVYKFKNEGSFGASWDPGRGSVYRVELFLAVRLGHSQKMWTWEQTTALHRGGRALPLCGSSRATIDPKWWRRVPRRRREVAVDNCILCLANR